jgi:hypothetical protein
VSETEVWKKPMRLYHGARVVLVTESYVGHGPEDPSGYYYHYEGETVRHWISTAALKIRFTDQPLTFEQAMERRFAELASRRDKTIEAAIQGITAVTSAVEAVSVVRTEKGFCVVYANDDRMYFDATEM